ncbi:hypothetical protein EK904_006357 [Melospiza melodia maxima]|nr:hypothetical protein EK904_006357 [Melospiza melodia maxima]
MVRIMKAQEGKKKVVLAGCVPQAQPRQEYLKGLSIIGVQQIDRVVEVVEETIKGHSVRLLGQKKDNGKRLGGARLDLPKIRKNPLIEIISINTGITEEAKVSLKPQLEMVIQHHLSQPRGHPQALADLPSLSCCLHSPFCTRSPSEAQALFPDLD